MKLYRDDERILIAGFKKDALIELEILNHPVVDRCWELAEKYGSTLSPEYNFSLVWEILKELNELLGDNYW